ncbi:MAG: hypothetical protein EOP09_10065, partial [Proteobacteria bacterium]
MRTRFGLISYIIPSLTTPSLTTASLTKASLIVASLTLALIPSAQADLAEELDPVGSILAERGFKADQWTTGLHLTAGAGVASTVLFSDVDPEEKYGFGLNIKTEIGYYLNDRLAVEVGSLVNLTRMSSELLLWDTQFTVGIRSRIGNFFSFNEGT